MEIFKIIENLGIFTIASGLIIFLLQKYIVLFFNRKLKAFELELKSQSDHFNYQLVNQLENHKLELNILLDKASRIQEKRLLIIAKLYSKIITLHQAMETMTILIKKVSVFDENYNQKEEKNRIDNSRIAYNNFQLYFNKNRIFIPKKTTELIDNLKSEFFSTYFKYTALKEINNSDFKSNINEMKIIISKIKDQIPNIISQLEIDFRNLIGSN